MNIIASSRCDLVLHTDLQRLCCVWLHDSPYVQDELTSVFPNLTPMKHEGVGHGCVALIGHMVGCCSAFLLVLGLKARYHNISYHERNIKVTSDRLLRDSELRLKLELIYKTRQLTSVITELNVLHYRLIYIHRRLKLNYSFLM